MDVRCGPMSYGLTTSPPRGMMQLSRSSHGFEPRYRESSVSYDVKRDVYNEETFQQDYRRKSGTSGNLDIDITTFQHHVQCRCSWDKFLNCMLTIFPFLRWMCLYRFKEWLLGDLLAGVSVGLVQIPQVLTYSLLSRQLIPPLNISYAAFTSSVIYVIFGSCHQMSIGAFFLVSALMMDVLNLYPFNSGHLVLGTFLKEDFSDPLFFTGYNRSLSAVATTTFVTGVFQLIMGILGFGFIATYLPEAAINAYLTAVGLHIIVSQMTFILGIMISFNAGPVAFFYNIISYCISLPKANSTSILLFLAAVVILRVNKCIRISFHHYPLEFPMEAFLVVVFSALASKISIATDSGQTFEDMIPYSFLFPVFPDLGNFQDVVVNAFSLALVSSSLLIFLGKKIASFHNYSVSSNQDLIVIGICNVISSCFRSWVFTGAIVRTVIQDKSGGRQQFASLVGAGLMLLLMEKVESFFYALPNAVLAGIIVSNVLPFLENIYYLPSLWRQSQYDFIIWMMTFIAAIVLGLDVGLLVSVSFAFFIITVQSHRTKILLLGQIPNTNIYRSINDYREILTFPGLKLFQCCNSITFVNVYDLKRRVLEEVEMTRVPLKEEEMHRLFPSSRGPRAARGYQFYCDCDELEPPPRVVYTERYETKENSKPSSLSLVRCTRIDSENMSPYSPDEQIPYRASPTFQKNRTQSYENVWLPTKISSSSSRPPDASGSQIRTRSDASSIIPATHTIILDFSMVHFVDAKAVVILRQMCNAFHNANILVLIAGTHSSVVKALERNEFFDAGITKTQLFLTLHDAVLFALQRKNTDSSDLSVDESETVIQETYSETDKDTDERPKISSSILEGPKNTSPNYARIQRPILEDSDLDLELEPILGSDNGLDEERESELEAESELEPETELEPNLELEPKPENELDLEFKPKPIPKSIPRPQTYPRQQYWPPSTPSQNQPRTRSVEKRQPSMIPYPSRESDTDDL